MLVVNATMVRSSHPEVFLENGVLKICSKFTGVHPCRSAISSNLIDIAFRHRCSPVNLLHIFRTPFLKNTSGRLLLDGAKNMYGIKNGVSNKILSENPKAFFTRCFGHALNLAVGDMVKNARFLKDSMDTTYDNSNLIRKPPKRDGMLQKIQKDTSLEYSGFRVFCPRRWAVRADQ